MFNNVKSNSVEEIATNWNIDQLAPDTESQWRIDGDGVYHIPEGLSEDDKEMVIHQPVLILERVFNVDTKQESVKIGWRDNLEQHECTVARSIISNPTKLKKLADKGLAVDFENAKMLTKYFIHLLNFRNAEIPVRYAVSSCGWKKLKEHSFFMVGMNAVGSDLPLVSINQDIDDSGILSAYRQEGDFETWLKVARKLNAYPIAAFGLAAAFLSPILNDLGVCDSPIVDYSGETSTGKSTVLRFITSVWGNPSGSSDGLIRSWNSTSAYLEYYGAMMHDLPLFLDDSSYSNAKKAEQFIISYTNGTARGRANSTGVVGKTAEVIGVLFSTGEHRLSDVSKNCGVGARILGFWGSPFGTNLSELVREINETARNNYGFAGKEVLKHYIADRDTYIELLKHTISKSRMRLLPQCSDGPSERLADACALVEAAGELANDVLNLRWDMRAIVDTAFSKLIENKKTNIAMECIEFVGSWLSSKDMGGKICADGRLVSGNKSDIIGRHIIDGGVHRIGILPDAFKKFIRSQQQSYNTILSHWDDKGWIDTDKDRKTKKERFNGVHTYMIVLSEDGMKAAFGDAQDVYINVCKGEPDDCAGSSDAA